MCACVMCVGVLHSVSIVYKNVLISMYTHTYRGITRAQNLLRNSFIQQRRVSHNPKANSLSILTVSTIQREARNILMS